MTDDSPDDFPMENVPPPPPVKVDGMPLKASSDDAKALGRKIDQRSFWDFRPLAPSIGLAAARFTESCEGGGYFKHNCAHYLSNAFVKAGYFDLTQPHPFVNARCQRTGDDDFPGCDPSAKRIIRAKELEKWFQHKARRTKELSQTRGDTVQERFAAIKGTGLWAVFQRDTESGGYPGGHACIIDTDTWRYYGTGTDGYWYWKIQHCYQW
jgi:hypothetical protein